MATEDTNRIIVAGAGPVGTVCALALARAGIPVTLLEAEPNVVMDLRAATFHASTLDLLDELDVSRHLVDMGLITPVWQFRDRQTGKAVAQFDFALIKDETNHPYRLQCEQFKLTGLLAQWFATMELVTLRFSSPVTGVRQDADGVSALVRRPDGSEEEVRGRYLIAGDGASSAVRRSLGLGFTGETYPEMFVQIGTTFDFAAQMPDLASVSYCSDPVEWVSMIRVRDLWRLVFPSRPGETDAEAVAPAAVEARLQGFMPRAEKYDVAYAGTYRVHQRVAEKFRVGRVFLAGDSAHLNNPLGGMGMNSGIQDGVNLCRKLIAVWGGADDALLDRYERQRQPAAVNSVQASAARNRRILNETDEAARQAQLEELTRTAADPELAKAFLRRAAMIESWRASEATP